jgi:hypothetical protein
MIIVMLEAAKFEVSPVSAPGRRDKYLNVLMLLRRRGEGEDGRRGLTTELVHRH